MRSDHYGSKFNFEDNVVERVAEVLNVEQVKPTKVEEKVEEPKGKSTEELKQGLKAELKIELMEELMREMREELRKGLADATKTTTNGMGTV